MLPKINIDVFAMFPTAYRNLQRRRAAYYPFAAVFLVECLILSLIILAPREPLSRLLAPPIQTFWGEQYLHYPAHYVLVPYLFFLGQLWSSIFCGSLASGLCAAFLAQKKNKYWEAILAAAKKYVPLASITLFTSALLLISSRATILIAVHAGISGYLSRSTPWLAPLLIIVRFMITILVHAIMVYAVSVIIVEKKGLWGALRRSYSLCRKHFASTLVMVGFPMILLFPVIMSQNRPRFFIDNAFPEAVALICLLNAAVSSLIIAPLITACATNVVLKEQTP